jgi:rod shape determining protein RodA
MGGEALRAKRFLRDAWPLLVLVAFLGGVGIVSLYSAAGGEETWSRPPIYLKQGIFLGVGLLAGALVALIDYRRWLDHAWLLYGACVGLLVAVLVIGKVTSGSQRWLMLGPIAIQPSELAKWVLLLAIARHFQSNESAQGYYTLRDVLRPSGAMGLVAVLIVLEPDLGSTILVVLLCLSMMIAAGLRIRSLLKVVGVGVVCLPFAWKVLAEYQRRRIMTFLDPQQDPLGAGYHVTQSKIAVGSGGLFGKGYLQGTQSQLHFLPEHHTDFAFSVWAEEWGFVGCVLLLAAFLLLLLYGLSVASRATDPVARLVALGVVAFFFWPVAINVAMTLGLMPVVGIALPFISYGGSSLVTSMMALGLLLNVHSRRFLF